MKKVLFSIAIAAGIGAMYAAAAKNEAGIDGKEEESNLMEAMRSYL